MTGRKMSAKARGNEAEIDDKNVILTAPLRKEMKFARGSLQHFEKY